MKNSATDDAAAQLKDDGVVGLTPGQKAPLGRLQRRQEQDFAQVQGAETIRSTRGDGKGAFVKSKTAKAPNIADRKRSAIAIVASGDFDGDSRPTSSRSRPRRRGRSGGRRQHARRRHDPLRCGRRQRARGAEDVPLAGGSHHRLDLLSRAGDLGGDGKDDLVITTKKGEIVAFGNADRAQGGPLGLRQHPRS